MVKKLNASFDRKLRNAPGDLNGATITARR
jgi:hypothetical protein